MRKLNIVPLMEEYAEDLSREQIELYTKGAIDSVAFIFTLVPEGIPALDKASECVRRFKVFQKILKDSGMPVGILIQASWGHGWLPDSPTDFQRIVKIDGTDQYTMCPEGEPFRQYIYKSMVTVASAEPDFIMVDDDTRFITGRDSCFCPLHTALYNKRTGKHLTSEELREAVASDEKVAREHDAVLQESANKYAHLIRDAIDSVNPKIPGSFCLCAEDVRHAPLVARILAGKGNEVIIRINNGRYLMDSLRNIPNWLYKTAWEVAALPAEAAILCEPDTCPQNRYSTAAAMLKMHLTMSAFEGCCGGKMWITRTTFREPDSGKAYRDVLEKNAGFLDVVLNMKPSWRGACVAMPPLPVFNFPSHWRDGGWNDMMGRMGLPVYMSKTANGCVALTELQVSYFTDDELRKLFVDNNVLLDGTAALAISDRGLSELMGCRADKWDLPKASLEVFDGHGMGMSAPNDLAKLSVIDSRAKVLTIAQHKSYQYATDLIELAPASILFEHDGRKVITMACHYGCEVNFRHACMFSEGRKHQLQSYMEMLNGCPVWSVGDNEIYFKAGELPDGERVVSYLNIGLDLVTEIKLAGPWTDGMAPEMLNGDGSWKPLAVRRDAAGNAVMDVQVMPLDVVVLKWKAK